MPLDSLYGYQIRSGKLYGLKSVYKFGYREEVSTTKVIIGTVGINYDALETAQQLKVSSSSTSDTSAGTGARTVQIYGVDGNYNEVSETIIMNGQTAVTTANSYLRVYRGKVLTAGSAKSAAGAIHIGYGTVTSGVPATKLMTIPLGENQSLIAAWTVPSGYTGYLYQATISSGTESSNKYVIARVEVREVGSVWQTKEKGSFTVGELRFDLALPAVIPEKSDIKLTAIASSGTQDVSGSFVMVYEKN
jgi:hypothetical protein